MLVCRQMLSMLQTKPWQQSAGSCQHLDCSHPRVWFYITSSKQQQELVWNEKPSKVMPGPTCKHVCVQRESCPAGSGSIDGHLSSGLHLGGGSPPVPPQAQLSRSADYPYSSPGINARGCKQSSTEPESLKDFFLGPPTSSTLQISWPPHSPSKK